MVTTELGCEHEVKGDWFRDNVLAASGIDSTERESLCKVSSLTLTDKQIAQCQRFDMEKGLGINLMSLSPSQLIYAFDFWDLGKGFECVESLEEGLLSITAIRSLVKFYSTKPPLEDYLSVDSVKVDTGCDGWNAKSRILLESLGICSVTGGFSYCRKGFKYTDFSKVGLPRYIENMLKRMGLLLDTRVRTEAEGERVIFLKHSRTTFLQRVLANRYQNGDGILFFADGL